MWILVVQFLKALTETRQLVVTQISHPFVCCDENTLITGVRKCCFWQNEDVRFFETGGLRVSYRKEINL